MADRLIRALVSIPHDNGLPDDAVQNTWHFDDDDDPLAGWEDSATWVEQALTGFYQAIDGVMMPSSVGDEATVKLYDLREPTPRVPKSTFTIALTPGAGYDPHPAEVAVCMSFQADPVSGISQARRRGRLFLGPLRNGSVDIVNGVSRPSATLRTTIAAAASNLIDGVVHPASPGLHLKWAVYSPTLDAAGTIDDAFNDVTSGWIDDAWDVQRRRGAAPTTRTTFS